jgi:hypothetical protein
MERKTEGIIVDEITAKRQSDEALAEMMNVDGSYHNMKTHTVLVEKDGQMVEIEVPIDDIDLLDDFDDEDLTEEGERQLGLIDTDYDSTSNESVERKVRERVAVVNLEIDSMDDELNIVCPYTDSPNVYQIDSNTWASYETDQHFVVRIKMRNEED